MKVLFCGEAFPRSPEMLRALLPDHEIQACPRERVREVGLTADVLIPLMHRLEPDLIARTRARMIQQWGVGLEGVDIPGATARGILVCNVPADATPNADSTAEHALFLMLGVARRIHACMAAFHQGVWGTPVGEALFGNAALIVGLGKVGKALATRLKALGMNVEAIRKTPDFDKDQVLGLTRVGEPSDLFEMASRADFVISTVVLDQETRGMFSKPLFDVMKPSAFVINASRGPVVNERDLIEALQKRKIAGAGLDVFNDEPLDPASPLLTMENVFATPHVGGATRQNVEAVGKIVADNIRRLEQGRPLLYCVNLNDLPR